MPAIRGALGRLSWQREPALPCLSGLTSTQRTAPRPACGRAPRVSGTAHRSRRSRTHEQRGLPVDHGCQSHGSWSHGSWSDGSVATLRRLGPAVSGRLRSRDGGLDHRFAALPAAVAAIRHRNPHSGLGREGGPHRTAGGRRRRDLRAGDDARPVREEAGRNGHDGRARCRCGYRHHRPIRYRNGRPARPRRSRFPRTRIRAERVGVRIR